MRSKIIWLAPVAMIIALIVTFWRHGPQGDLGIQHWLAIHTGTDNCPPGLPKSYYPVCRFYGFWSGFGSVIPWVLIGSGGALATAAVLVRQHNCEVHGCWRLGRHSTAAGHMVCRKHHPDDHITAQDVKEAHDAAKVC